MFAVFSVFLTSLEYMSEDMYAERGQFWCLSVFVEEGIQLWNGIQTTLCVCHRLHGVGGRGGGISKGVSEQATLKTRSSGVKSQADWTVC